MSARVRDTDHGYAALLERAAKGRAGITVGVHADAEAADYAARAEFGGKLGLRELADQAGPAVTGALRAAAVEGVLQGSSPLPAATKAAGDAIANELRGRAVKKSGTLAASVAAKVAR